MKGRTIYKAVALLYAWTLLCALLGNALSTSSLPLQPGKWLPMILIGLAGIMIAVVKRPKVDKFVGWYGVLVLWCIVVDVGWGICSCESVARLATYGIFVIGLRNLKVTRRFLILTLYLCTLLCAAMKVAVYLQIIPSSFSLFDNEAGYAAAFVLGLPAVFYLFHTQKKQAIFLLIITLMGVALTCSRTAWLACLLVSAYWCKSTFFPLLNFRKWHGALVGTVMLLAFVALWMVRPASAIGRWYIDLISCKLIMSHPLAGMGHCGFYRAYMNAQADYISMQAADTPFAVLADNTPHAFNEVLSWSISYGLIGLLFLGFWLWKCLRPVFIDDGRMEAHDRMFVRNMLIGAFVLSMMSYPWTYSYAVLVFLSVMAFLPSSLQWQSRFSCVAQVLAGLFVIISAGVIATGEYHWRKADEAGMRNDVAAASTHYERALALLPTRVELGYNYAADLNAWGKYAESQQRLKRLSLQLNDYDTELLAADNAYHLNQMQACQMHLLQAGRMIPNRFFPLWSRFDLARERKQIKVATQLAGEIMNKPVKVNSAEIMQMKQDAQCWLETVRYNQRE